MNIKPQPWNQMSLEHVTNILKDKPPSKINCSFKIMDQTVFFALILSFVISGIISLIKGTRGDWDNKVKPEDMLGPGKEK